MHTKPRTRKRTYRLETRKGAAVVEFAVVAPLMILLTTGMMEMGRVVMVKQLLVNASREGARLAVLPEATTIEVQNAVEQELQASSIHGATITLTPTVIESAPPGSPVTIAISIPAADVSWIPKPMFTFSNTLSSATTMRREGR